MLTPFLVSCVLVATQETSFPYHVPPEELSLAVVKICPNSRSSVEVLGTGLGRYIDEAGEKGFRVAPEDVGMNISRLFAKGILFYPERVEDWFYNPSKDGGLEKKPAKALNGCGFDLKVRIGSFFKHVEFIDGGTTPSEVMEAHRRLSDQAKES